MCQNLGFSQSGRGDRAPLDCLFLIKRGRGMGEWGVFRVAGEGMGEFGNVVGVGTNREDDSERDEQV